ncbi:MAG: hypothetical protein MUF81_05145 [Verrucomicrobia bacterium]|jgi:hypothetical protein|nr:hypothetical protein [Verrucomicrobiota bacterium]
MNETMELLKTKAVGELDALKRLQAKATENNTGQTAAKLAALLPPSSTAPSKASYD